MYAEGTPCKVVDVVMNDQIVEKAEKNADIFYFMAQIISNYLLEKYKIAVAEDSIESFIQTSSNSTSSTRAILSIFKGLEPKRVLKLRKFQPRSKNKPKPTNNFRKKKNFSMNSAGKLANHRKNHNLRSMEYPSTIKKMSTVSNPKAT